MKRRLHTIRAAIGAVVFAWMLSAPSTSAAPFKEGGRTYQDIDIISVPGAECTLRRAGEILSTLKLPPSSKRAHVLRVARVDLTENHSDIVITCVLAGYRDRTKVNSFGPITYALQSPPCIVTHAQENELRGCKEPLSHRQTSEQYHDLVQISLEPFP